MKIYALNTLAQYYDHQVFLFSLKLGGHGFDKDYEEMLRTAKTIFINSFEENEELMQMKRELDEIADVYNITYTHGIAQFIQSLKRFATSPHSTVYFDMIRLNFDVKYSDKYDVKIVKNEEDITIMDRKFKLRNFTR